MVQSCQESCSKSASLEIVVTRPDSTTGPGNRAAPRSPSGAADGSGATQHAPGARTRMASTSHGHLARDQDVLDARRKSVGLGIGGEVPDGGRVEDDQIRIRADLDPPLGRESELLGGPV